jgi:hypothetical protein
MFFKWLERSLVTGSKWREEEFRAAWLVEQGRPFTRGREPFPTRPRGEPLQVVRGVHARWRGRFPPGARGP